MQTANKLDRISIFFTWFITKDFFSPNLFLDLPASILCAHESYLSDFSVLQFSLHVFDLFKRP